MPLAMPVWIASSSASSRSAGSFSFCSFQVWSVATSRTAAKRATSPLGGLSARCHRLQLAAFRDVAHLATAGCAGAASAFSRVASFSASAYRANSLATQNNASLSSQARIAFCASREADSTVTFDVVSSALEGVRHGERDCADACGAQATAANRTSATLTKLGRWTVGALSAMRRSF